jgi:hypothetical protein
VSGGQDRFRRFVTVTVRSDRLQAVGPEAGYHRFRRLVTVTVRSDRLQVVGPEAGHTVSAV